MSLPRRALLLLGILLVLAFAWRAPLDASAEEHAGAGLKRALASFAAARALNAVISVAQGTEVAVQPIGVGVVLAPGQVLDPVNDLVEQFSSLMLSASVAFGVQLALLRFGGHEAVSLALSVLAIAWGWRMWRGERTPGWLDRLLAGMLLVRFAVPVVVLGSDAGFRLFLEKDYEAGRQSIELSTKQFETLSPPAPAAIARGDPKGWWPLAPGTGKMIEDMKDEVVRALDVRKRYEAMKGAAGEAVEHIVKLIVVFLLQTLVVPLLLLWALVHAARLLVRIPAQAS